MNDKKRDLDTIIVIGIVKNGLLVQPGLLFIAYTLSRCFLGADSIIDILGYIKDKIILED